MLNFSATRTKLGELHLYKFGVIFILILIVLFLSFTNWSPNFWIMLYVTFFFFFKTNQTRTVSILSLAKRSSKEIGERKGKKEINYKMTSFGSV